MANVKKSWSVSQSCRPSSVVRWSYCFRPNRQSNPKFKSFRGNHPGNMSLDLKELNLANTL